MSTWMHRQGKDVFVKKRDAMNLLSRSFFKIEEICKKFNILQQNGTIIDLGCSPGGWCQFFLSKKQYIIGIDLLPIKMNINEFYNLDICDFKYTKSTINSIFSDIAVNFSGLKLVDDENMCAIVKEIDRIVQDCLSNHGSLVVKLNCFTGTSCVSAQYKKLFNNNM